MAFKPTKMQTWTGSLLLLLYLLIAIVLYAMGSWQNKPNLKLAGKVMLLIPTVLTLGAFAGAGLMSA